MLLEQEDKLKLVHLSSFLSFDLLLMPPMQFFRQFDLL